MATHLLDTSVIIDAPDNRHGRVVLLLGTPLNLGDVIIAAVAIHDGLTLLTDNTKDFPMPNLSLYPLPKA